MPGPRLLHPARFLGVALVLGGALAIVIEGGVHRLAWTRDSVEYWTFFGYDDGGQRSAAFVIAVPVTAWILRSRICSARGASAAWLAAWIGLPGAVAFSGSWYAIEIARELVRRTDEIAWGDVLLGAFTFPLLAVVFSVGLLPLTFPLSWASVIFLRRASGGMAPAAGGVEALRGSI